MLALKARLSLGHGELALSQIILDLSEQTIITMFNIAHRLFGEDETGLALGRVTLRQQVLPHSRNGIAELSSRNVEDLKARKTCAVTNGPKSEHAPRLKGSRTLVESNRPGVGVIAFAGFADLELGCGCGRHKAVHGLHELPVRLVRNCNHVQQHLILIQFVLVNMERAECADLKYPRLLN
jgi:hypothetical protein